MSNRIVKIANAQAFWGDAPDAAAKLLARQPDLDYLTMDYLAEVSMSILAMQRLRDPSAGFAGDFVEVVRSLAPSWKRGSKTKLVSNAGGLDPRACAIACKTALDIAGLSEMKIAIVSGDDVLPMLHPSPADGCFNNLETHDPIATVLDRVVTANAYLGAQPIAQALAGGADIVITGRVADPSLVVGCGAHHFGWQFADYSKLAGATVAGHLIECGTQATGGICTDWLSLPDVAHIGFPIVEVSSDGSIVLTKPAGSGGAVNRDTVREQLLYEIGDPDNYLSPDVTVSFLGLRVEEIGIDRVAITGAIGRAPTDSYKVSATYRDGFKSQGQLTIFGRDAVAKARLCGRIILTRLTEAGLKPQRSLIECLGSGACAPGVINAIDESQLLETVLRISVADERNEVCEMFAKHLASLITAGPPGVTGYAVGRPRVQPVFGYWPCLIAKKEVMAVVDVL